ncbi:MAG: hypothetical protein ABH878_10450 [bacterium]
MRGLRWLSEIRRDDGGVTFIEVLATFVMLVAAVIATAYAMFFGQEALTVNMQKQQVLRIVQQELEYWVGRVYTGSPEDPNTNEMMGSPNWPYRTIKLDAVDASSPTPIEVRLYYDPIVAFYDPNSGAEPGVDQPTYWIITVWAEWTEPDGQIFSKARGNEVSLTTYVNRVGE